MVTLSLNFAPQEDFASIDNHSESVGLLSEPGSSGKQRAKRTSVLRKTSRSDSDSDEYGSPPRLRKKLHRSVGRPESEDDDGEEEEELCAYNHLDTSTETSDHTSDKTSKDDHEDHHAPITPTPLPQIIVTDVDRSPTSIRGDINYLIAIKPNPGSGSGSSLCAQDPFVASRLASVAMALARVGHVKQAWPVFARSYAEASEEDDDLNVAPKLLMEVAKVLDEHEETIEYAIQLKLAVSRWEGNGIFPTAYRWINGEYRETRRRAIRRGV
ncbi:hypothetical protein B0A48_06800 [Cryoendolithus antarcticus]|uniref:Uncharacterized protein n=1 Tax=Cryoendolithus antarcticus TaxID=1507870 RepID=A0A1V8T9C3_9PEZI|nr:hypothetical protein B0A48_06800 [Cryoendolithus antarcticus]